MSKTNRDFTARKLKNYWRSVDKQDSGCWLWTGGINAVGTGHIGVVIDGVVLNTAHRLGWFLARGELLPKEIILVHTCGNKLCQNPDHLTKSTYEERLSYQWIRAQAEPAQVNHSRRSMTAAEAQEIRDLRERQNKTLMEIVKITGRTYKTVSYVVNYKSHNGVPKGPKPKNRSK